MQNDKIDSAIDELASDLEEARRMRQLDDTQFNRRVYVRSLFAYLECVTYWVRQNAIERDLHILGEGGRINWERHFLLQEKIPVINDEGEIKKQTHKVAFQNRFAFSVRVLAELVKCEEDVFSHHGWKQLLKAAGIRDRLTHPKQKSAVAISDNDLAACHEGYAWFSEYLIGRFTQSVRNMTNGR